MIKASEIENLLTLSNEYTVAVKIKSELTERSNERDPFYLTKDELDEILHWKLRRQYRRSKHWQNANTPEIIKTITSAALAIDVPDFDYEVELRISILTCLRGVGVPVASAILALVYPEKYAVVDFRGWRQVFGKNKTLFSIGDYKRYLAQIRPLAKELDWPIQEVDLAIWELDLKKSIEAKQQSQSIEGDNKSELSQLDMKRIVLDQAIKSVKANKCE